MSDKIIEPSEIIIERENGPKDKVVHINPQTRFLARFFDYGVFFVFLMILKALMGRKFPVELFDHIIPFEYAAWIPFEAAFLTLLKTTPGKFLLKTKLTQGRKHRIDFQTALKRSFQVWFRGLGMGIAILNVLCMVVASNKLRVLGKTSWDREDNFTISHYPLEQWRVSIALIFTVLSFLAYYGTKYGI